MATKRCPQCASSIPEQAKRCPQCMADIAPRKRGQKILSALGTAAVRFRDWIGVPTAVAALVTALFYPAIGTVVCTENPIRVDDMTESPKLAE